MSQPRDRWILAQHWVLIATLALGQVAPAAAVLPPAEVLAIPPALQRVLEERVLAGDPAPAQRFNRLMHLAFDPADAGLGLTYADDADGSVAQTVSSRRANCLSFTLLFLALARAAGLEATAQEIGETLDWRQDNNLLYRTDHINVLVRVAGRAYTVDIAGDNVIALVAPVPASDARLLAHHYNNLAMRHLEQGRLPPAQEAMRTALQLDGGYAVLWSNAGVLALRAGDEATAEHHYARALALDADNASALFNMLGLLQRRGDARRSEVFRQRLQRVQQRDPFHHVLLASDAERDGDLRRAIGHWQRAIRLRPGEHRFHGEIARVYERLGETRPARKALQRARALSHDAARAGYESRLHGLRPPP